MPDQEQGPEAGLLLWHTGQDDNNEEGLHLWAEMEGARVEIRKRVSRILGRPGNGDRVWEVFVNRARQGASHLSLQAAKEAALQGERQRDVNVLGAEWC